MKKKMTQEQRLDTLVEAFKADSVQYKDLQTHADTEGKRRILRCRRPGFPAVRVVFPGHVGPSYTASVPSQLDLSIMTV